MKSEPTEIRLFDRDGKPAGIGRVWQNSAHGHLRWSWAHPDGSEGREQTFGAAVAELEGCTDLAA